MPHDDPNPGMPRRIAASLATLAGAVVWTHALGGPLGAGPSSALPLTAAAVVAAMAGTLAFPSPWRASILSSAAGLGVALAGSLSVSAPLVPSLAVLASAVAAAAGAWLSSRLPCALDRWARRHRALMVVWTVVALAAVVQVSRLSTYMTDADSDWFLSTRHPFYAKHECANAYVYGAELDRRGEPNVYDAAHYPGLTRDAEPVTEIAGMTPEDPFQYAPQFLLLPRLALALTDDYQAIRTVWFGLNVTLCVGAVFVLAGWVGGRAGGLAALLSPLVLLSFPVLHNFQYGQFHFATIALAVLGLIAFSTHRSMLGGTLLASAILSKLFPAVLLVPLAVQRRWRDLGWTAAAGAGLTALTLLVSGPAPFEAFFTYHLPRLADGSAFAFGEAWPEVATLVTAGNQGVHGMFRKLAALGVPGTDGPVARGAVRLFTLLVLGAGIAVGVRSRGAGRVWRAAAWLGLLGLGSLASTGAWADYVPVTCIWVLAVVAPTLERGSVWTWALAGCAVLQFFLLGAVPLGGWSDARWMIPLSLVSALAMLATFAAAALRPLPRRYGLGSSGRTTWTRPVSALTPVRSPMQRLAVLQTDRAPSPAATPRK